MTQDPGEPSRWLVEFIRHDVDIPRPCPLKLESLKEFYRRAAPAMSLDDWLDRLATLAGTTVERATWMGHEWVTFIPKPIGVPSRSA